MLWFGLSERVQNLESICKMQDQEIAGLYARLNELTGRNEKFGEAEVNVISLYRSHDVWVYDDEGVGPNGRYSRSGEVLVPSITRMIDTILAGNGKIPEDYYNGGLSLIFGRNPVPNYVAKLSRRDGEVDNYLLEEMAVGGEVINVANTEVVGYLCPAMLDYFVDYPEEFYVAFSF